MKMAAEEIMILALIQMDAVSLTNKHRPEGSGGSTQPFSKTFGTFLLLTLNSLPTLLSYQTSPLL